MANTAVFGIYSKRDRAEAAVFALRLDGFRSTDISVLWPQNTGSKDFAHEKGSKAPEGAAAGGGLGAVIGGTLAWLVGFGALVIPGLGRFELAGPIVAALAGIGAGGTVGAITGAAIGWRKSEYIATRYMGRMRKGGILLSVHADDLEWTKKGWRILEATGAEQISTIGESLGDFGNTERPMALETTPRPYEANMIDKVRARAEEAITKLGQTV